MSKKIRGVLLLILVSVLCTSISSTFISPKSVQASCNWDVWDVSGLSPNYNVGNLINFSCSYKLNNSPDTPSSTLQIVIGLVDQYGNNVEGLVVTVYDGIPAVSPDFTTGTTSQTMPAPSILGTYTLLAAQDDQSSAWLAIARFPAQSSKKTLATITVTEPQSNHAPTLSRESPNNSSLPLKAGSSQSFTVSASDQDGNLSSIAWYVNGSAQRNVTISGYSALDTFTWTFSSTGTFTVEARAFDSQGAASNTISWTVTVTENNHAPTLSRESPNNSSLPLKAGSSQSFTVSASDQDGNLSSIAWYVNGSAQRNVTISGYSALDTFTWTFSSTGTFTVEARAFDSQGAASNTISWTVTVNTESTRWAIIICGSERIDMFNSTNKMYSLLISLGYDNEHIYYLSPFDANGVDSNITPRLFDWAIHEVAKKSNNTDLVFIYWASHGGVYNDWYWIHLGDEEIITPDVLDIKLDTIVCKQMIILIDSCRSGGFINDLTKDDTNRTIATSSAADRDAYPSLDLSGGCFTIGFLEAFIEIDSQTGQLKADENNDNKISVQEAFDYAEPKTHHIWPWHDQLPQLVSQRLDADDVFI